VALPRPAQEHNRGHDRARNQGYNHGLDLVRSAAILLVLFSHTADWWMGASRATEISSAYVGRIGVEAFFSLSGFLIGGILLRTMDAGFDGPALLRFWCRRWMRTLPAYWVVIGLLCWHFGVMDWRSPVFLQNFVPRTQWAPLTPHTWSLSLEEWFYLVVPLLLMGAAALLRRPQGQGRRWAVPLVCTALVTACTLGRWSAGMAPHPVWGPEPLVNPVLRLDCAAWGLLAAWLARRRTLPAAAAWGLLGAGGAALLVLGWVWAGVFAPERLAPWGFGIWGAAWAPLHPALEEMASACIVLALHRLVPRGTRPLAWAAGGVAALSYSLYLVHVPVLYLMRGAGMDDASDWGVRGAMVAGIAAAALALRWGVERPVLALRERLAPERRAGAAALALAGRR